MENDHGEKYEPESEGVCHIPANIFLPKVNNRNTRKRSELCSKLTIKTLQQCVWSCFLFFLIVRYCSFFMGIIYCSSVVLVLAFNTRGVYNFITKKANIPVNLVPFFNGVSFLFCCFLKSGVTKEQKSIFLLKSKKVRVIYSKKDKTLLLVKR